MTKLFTKTKSKKGKSDIATNVLYVALGGAVLFFGGVYFSSYFEPLALTYSAGESFEKKEKPKPRRIVMNAREKEVYDTKLHFLAHIATTTTATTTPVVATSSVATATSTKPKPLWPVEAAYPNVGALLPFNRIVAYYGNFYSKQMGVLGEYPVPEMLAKLGQEVARWEAADPETPVIPAIHYIVTSAQQAPGDGKYRLRMPNDQIEKAIELAKQVDGIVFLDIQVGLSDLKSEIPLLKKYLELPQVHLAIDPEFSMQTSGKRPGTVIGTFDAADVNYAANYLAELVREKELPPKVLIVHRFTEKMVTNYQNITPLPEVQIVMDMDGWGFPAQKKRTYHDVIQTEPVQFTGVKLFYKNDFLQEPKRMLTPAEVLGLTPSPSYIQYQ
jgi:hypothetical protein